MGEHGWRSGSLQQSTFKGWPAISEPHDSQTVPLTDEQTDADGTEGGRVLFDVTGVVHWYAFFSHPSGIQRVTEKLIASLSGRGDVEFVARMLGSDTFYRM